MRTTPPPCRDIVQIIPELREKARTTVRLHPRLGDVQDKSASKIGGDFLWPSAETWPSCIEHQIPYVGVLQLQKTDVPELGFPQNTDLFQLLWCPRDHDPECIPTELVFWRSAKDIINPLPHSPVVRLSEEDTYYDGGYYLPNPCVLHPERVLEFPDHKELPESTNEELATWDLRVEADLAERLKDFPRSFPPAQWLYMAELSVAPGTKVGGYAEWIQYPDTPSCKCNRPMELLLTISTLEPIGNRRWGAVEDIVEENPHHLQSMKSHEWHEALNRRQHVMGLEIGDGGNIYYFVCRQCPDLPIRATMQCG